jgi:hypothetical protein
MSRELSEKERETLEAMIDASSVGAVLGALADICWLKAQHIAESWQDRPLYESWCEVEELLREDSLKVAQQEKGRT